jgi:hypothetical protein|tara:strand:+ start:3655 stop:3783 length:129 start_codon:yes stop_codon:yes gene_type:complete
MPKHYSGKSVKTGYKASSKPRKTKRAAAVKTRAAMPKRKRKK